MICPNSSDVNVAVMEDGRMKGMGDAGRWGYRFEAFNLINPRSLEIRNRPPPMPLRLGQSRTLLTSCGLPITHKLRLNTCHRCVPFRWHV